MLQKHTLINNLGLLVFLFGVIGSTTVLGQEEEKYNDYTLGANLYLNPITRIMLNYTLADLDQVGKTNIGQVRSQVDF